MKREQSNSLFFTVIIILFIASFGLLHSRKKITAASLPTALSSNPLENVSLEQARSYINQLIIARSPGLLAHALEDLSSQRVIELADRIIHETPSTLTRDDKIQFLLALASSYAQDKALQQNFFKLLITYATIDKKEIPILVVAVQGDYVQVIPAFIAWNKQEHPELLLIDQALLHMVTHDKIELSKKFLSQGIRLTPEQADKLLTLAVQQNKNVKFVPMLINQGANPNQIIDKYTLLMLAVINHNKDMVYALLEAGASVNIITDNATGSALQLAIERNYSDIDQLLRKYGAQ
jgi:hypothetical protein